MLKKKNVNHWLGLGIMSLKVCSWSAKFQWISPASSSGIRHKLNVRWFSRRGGCLNAERMPPKAWTFQVASMSKLRATFPPPQSRAADSGRRAGHRPSWTSFAKNSVFFQRLNVTQRLRHRYPCRVCVQKPRVNTRCVRLCCDQRPHLLFTTILKYIGVRVRHLSRRLAPDRVLPVPIYKLRRVTVSLTSRRYCPPSPFRRRTPMVAYQEHRQSNGRWIRSIIYLVPQVGSGPYKINIVSQLFILYL